MNFPYVFGVLEHNFFKFSYIHENFRIPYIQFFQFPNPIYTILYKCLYKKNAADCTQIGLIDNSGKQIASDVFKVKRFHDIVKPCANHAISQNFSLRRSKNR